MLFYYILYCIIVYLIRLYLQHAVGLETFSCAGETSRFLGNDASSPSNVRPAQLLRQDGSTPLEMSGNLTIKKCREGRIMMKSFTQLWYTSRHTQLVLWLADISRWKKSGIDEGMAPDSSNFCADKWNIMEHLQALSLLRFFCFCFGDMSLSTDCVCSRILWCFTSFGLAWQQGPSFSGQN